LFIISGTDLDGGPELGVEQPAQTAVVATEQLAQRLAGHPLIRRSRRSARDLVVRGVDGGHHHLVTGDGGGAGGGGISGRLADGVAHDVRHVPERLTGVRKSLRHRERERAKENYW